ncbi:MAG TPA: FAD-dependent oxidoreductase, partial [Anaerolineales bacterium]|nr:FAD-dependent oxidoreductase [Anaerolineales bacterium]
DSTRVIACDSIVFAAGQATGLTEGFGLELNRFGYPVDPQSGKSGHRTSLDGVFCAGDVITGTSFVINAIESGRQ